MVESAVNRPIGGFFDFFGVKKAQILKKIF
jgi:hypothetical protein